MVTHIARLLEHVGPPCRALVEAVSDKLAGLAVQIAVAVVQGGGGS